MFSRVSKYKTHSHFVVSNSYIKLSAFNAADFSIYLGAATKYKKSKIVQSFLTSTCDINSLICLCRLQQKD